MYEYPRAGKNAPEGVRKTIEEFRQLPEEERARRPLLYYLLGDGTPPYKMSKEDSDYSDKTPLESQTCENCEFLYLKPYKNKYICSKIAGEIVPAGWCKLWEAQDKNK